MSKLFKTVFVAIFAFALALPCHAQLSSTNGQAAGKALFQLYLRNRKAGLIDLQNQNNISGIITLQENIRGISPTSAPKEFIMGLMDGSHNLVNKNNSGDIVKYLAIISKFDFSAGGGQDAIEMLVDLFNYLK